MNTKYSSPLLDLKALGEDGQFSGYGSVFGNKDSYGDIVVPGAFTKSLEKYAQKKARPKMLWQHNTGSPIGSWAKIEEDQKGLYLEGRLNLRLQKGAEAYELLKAGEIDGLSIGYRTIKSDADRTKDAMLLKELDLFEISLVTFPANDQALIENVKSAALLREAFAHGETPSLKSIEEYLRDGGFPDALATAFVSLGKQAFRQRDSGAETGKAERFLSALLNS